MSTSPEDRTEERSGLFGTEHRRTWTVVLDGEAHRVDVVYAALLGWMSIFVDGERRARGWREFQSAFGGATLACTVDGHRIEARVTQPYLVQSYAFSLSLDGQVLPGSDPQPASQRQWAIGIVGAVAAVVLFLIALVLVKQFV